MKLSISLAVTALLLAPATAHAGKEQFSLGSGYSTGGQGVRIAQQRRPGSEPRFQAPPTIDPDAVPPPDPNLPHDFIPIPDRWRLIEAVGVNEKWWDPYHQNTLKGDRPLFDDWFINIVVISDTIYEPRTFPIPVGIQTTKEAGANSLFGDPKTTVFNTNLITSLQFIKGNTAYKPPDYEIRITPVFNYNKVWAEEFRVLRVQPERGDERSDRFIGWQELFIDKHLRNVSNRYDFDSVRIGIQPFSTDFRGFLFQDNQMGVRLFGTRSNNIFQYNLAWFRKLEKDTNSGLNDLTEDIRDDDIFIANLYWQDFPVLGFVSQATVVYNRNREKDNFYFNNNGFLERPASVGDERQREYDVTYFGFNGDGHFGRLNLTVSAYYAFGEDSHNVFSGIDDSDIRAYFFAAEPSIDFSWIRIRGSFMYASGDDDPFDDREEGFDAPFENPQFAGADTSYWIRQTIPLIGGGGVILSGRNAMFPALRSSKEQGQSNFNNPGMTLIGVGTDLDITPEIRVSTNFNRLDFVDTSNLEFLRNQGDIDRGIGWDLSAALIWRPLFIQNVVFRLSGAMLVPDDGFKELFETSDDENDLFYSILANLVLTY
jgi:hypothetical protein